jgi:hypothetical protein
MLPCRRCLLIPDEKSSDELDQKNDDQKYNPIGNFIASL